MLLHTIAHSSVKALLSPLQFTAGEVASVAVSDYGPHWRQKAIKSVLLFLTLCNVGSSEHFSCVPTCLPFSSEMEVAAVMALHGRRQQAQSSWALVPHLHIGSDVPFVTWLQNGLWLKEPPDFFFPDKFVVLRSSYSFAVLVHLPIDSFSLLCFFL